MYIPKRIEWESKYKSLFINYHIKYNKWFAPKTNKTLHGYEYRFIRIGIDNMMFNHHDWYYDGNTYKGITILFFEFGFGSGFDYCEELIVSP